jgi:S4 domain protein YaaA
MDNLTVFINTEFITLGQFIKLCNLVSTGGQIKQFLIYNHIEVNGVIEKRRGRKLRENDIININDKTFIIAK